MEYAIELHDISYSYPRSDVKSLKNISLAIEKGKFVVLMGPSGAGKTTLSLCLNGLIPQLLEGELTGKVIVANKDVRKYRVQTMSKHLGLVLQDPETQIFGLTVEEDTAFGPRNFSVPVEEIRRRIDEALARVRLQGYKQRNTQELSGGEKQRLAIAGVLAMQPEILVLDEPASELDPAGRKEIYETLDNLRKEQNLTILLIEHSSEEIINRADEVIVVNQGEIAWRGAPGELFRNIPLLRRFGLRPLPVSLVGWELYQKGLIGSPEIPLDVSEAEQMIRRLFGERGQLTNRDQSFMASNQEQAILGNNQSPLNDLGRNMCRPKNEKLPALIEVSNLSYQYNSTQKALQGVNLAIQAGEFVALIGENGAGKTTLAKHFNALLKPTCGDVVIDGMNTREFTTPQLAQTVGYVFQNPDHQIFSVSVEKEMEYGLKNIGLREREIKERIDEALQLTGLAEQRKTHPFSLGKGERQMIAVASILALRPKILVIDEPTTGLDWAGIQKLMALIGQLHKSGTTIIMITHDMELVAQYAERSIVLKDGGIFLDGKTREIFADFEVLGQTAIVPPQIPRLTARLKDLGLQQILLDEREFLNVFNPERLGTTWR